MTLIPTLLFIDPETTVYQNLKRKLGDDDTDLYHATNAIEALKVLDAVSVDLLICVHRPDEIDPSTFLDAVQQKSPATVRL